MAQIFSTALSIEDDGDEDSSGKRVAPQWTPMDDPDYQEELEELGPPTKRAKCFGCRFIGEEDRAAIASEELEKLVRLMREGVGNTDPIAYSKEAAALYKKIRHEANRHAGENEEPLPEWNEASILQHMRHHNTVPKVQVWFMLDDLGKTAKRLKEKCILKRDEDGHIQYEERQTKLWLEVSKFRLQALRMYEKMMGGNEDDTTTKQFISTRGKNLYGFYDQEATTTTGSL